MRRMLVVGLIKEQACSCVELLAIAIAAILR